MIDLFRATPRRLSAAALLLSLCACGTLGPATTAPPALYALDKGPSAEPKAPRQAAPTLIVSPPQAAAGYTSQHIAYSRSAHQLEYYAHSEWIAPPARMIAPLIVAALEATGDFRAVVLAPSVAAGDLRLDTEIVRLQHDLTSQPSRVRLTLRAYLIDNATRTVLARQEFDESVELGGEGPYAAVIAANQAAHTVFGRLTDFCAAATRTPAP